MVTRVSRRGLVVGAGGVLGGSWAVGALHALHRIHGRDPADSDVFVGTSVGALVTVLLAAGVSTPDLVADQYGRRTDSPLDGARFDHEAVVSSAFPFRFGVGSPALLAQCVRHPLSQSPMTWCAALAPPGRGSLHALRALLGHVLPGSSWPARVGVLATDYDAGRRVHFGRGDADIADAVVASCSVPGYFPPVSVRGRRYVDGGIWSVTNADVLVGSGVTEAVVLAPMAAASFDSPTTPRAALERTARVLFNRALRNEVRALERAGIATTVLAPNAEDLAVMGASVMNPSRRLAVLEAAMRITQRRLTSGAW